MLVIKLWIMIHCPLWQSQVSVVSLQSIRPWPKCNLGEQTTSFSPNSSICHFWCNRIIEARVFFMLIISLYDVSPFFSSHSLSCYNYFQDSVEGFMTFDLGPLHRLSRIIKPNSVLKVCMSFCFECYIALDCASKRKRVIKDKFMLLQDAIHVIR